MSGGVLVRVPVADLDETYLGLEVLVTRPPISGTLDGASLSLPARTVAGGLSDVERVPAGTRVWCPCGQHAQFSTAPVTRLWVGGTVISVGDDAVILTAPPASLLDALAAASSP